MFALYASSLEVPSLFPDEFFCRNMFPELLQSYSD